VWQIRRRSLRQQWSPRKWLNKRMTTSPQISIWSSPPGTVATCQHHPLTSFKPGHTEQAPTALIRELTREFSGDDVAGGPEADFLAAALRDILGPGNYLSHKNIVNGPFVLSSGPLTADLFCVTRCSPTGQSPDGGALCATLGAA